MVADALQILDDHQQVERGVHLGGVGGDLLSEGVLDGVEVIVHLVVGGNDFLGGRLILPGQGGEGVQDHLVGFLAHPDGLADRWVAVPADGNEVGNDLRDVGGMVAHALDVGNDLYGRGDAAQVARHRLLAEQQGHAAMLDVPLHVVDPAIALDDGGSGRGVSGAEGLQRGLHRVGGVLAHLDQRRLQGGKVGLVLCANCHTVTSLISRTGRKCNLRCACPAGC